MATATTFYASHGPITDPEDYAGLFADLPLSIAALCAVVRGLYLHPIDAAYMNVRVPAERLPEQRVRLVSQRLRFILTLDQAPLCVERPPQRRMIGQCYAFATLLCSILRTRQVPARVRSGFAHYLTNGSIAYNHWICEYWQPNEARWVKVDPQMVPEWCAEHGGFDPADIPDRLFLSAAQVWQGCRAGEIDPDHYGYDDVHDMGYIGQQLLCDFAALNKVELLATDRWGLGLKPGDERSAAELVLLDKVAAFAADDSQFSERLTLYNQDERLRVPDDLCSSRHLVSREFYETEDRRIRQAG